MTVDLSSGLDRITNTMLRMGQDRRAHEESMYRLNAETNLQKEKLDYEKRMNEAMTVEDLIRTSPKFKDNPEAANTIIESMKANQFGSVLGTMTTRGRLTAMLEAAPGIKRQEMADEEARTHRTWERGQAEQTAKWREEDRKTALGLRRETLDYQKTQAAERTKQKRLDAIARELRQVEREATQESKRRGKIANEEYQNKNGVPLPKEKLFALEDAYIQDQLSLAKKQVLRDNPDLFGGTDTGTPSAQAAVPQEIKSRDIGETKKLISELTGMGVPPDKVEMIAKKFKDETIDYPTAIKKATEYGGKPAPPATTGAPVPPQPAQVPQTRGGAIVERAKDIAGGITDIPSNVAQAAKEGSLARDLGEGIGAAYTGVEKWLKAPVGERKLRIPKDAETATGKVQAIDRTDRTLTLDPSQADAVKGDTLFGGLTIDIPEKKFYSRNGKLEKTVQYKIFMRTMKKIGIDEPQAVKLLTANGIQIDYTRPKKKRNQDLKVSSTLSGGARA